MPKTDLEVKQKRKSSEVLFINHKYIDISKWGKTHWSVFLYIGDIIEKYSEYPITLDSNMRTLTSTRSILLTDLKNYEYITRHWNFIPGDDINTELSKGKSISKHDDYSCILDFSKEGLINLKPSDIKPNSKIKLSRKGTKIYNQLKEFLNKDNQINQFTPDL
jgi:hypothetical protein